MNTGMSLVITWHTLLEIGAGLIVFFEFGKWIISFGNPIVELKKKLEAHDKMLDNDKKHLEKIDRGLVKVDEGVATIGRAMNELLKHEITGNDIQELRQQQKLVNDYFYDAKRAEDED